MEQTFNKSALEHHIVAAGKQFGSILQSNKLSFYDCNLGLISRRLIVDLPLQTVSKVEPKDSGWYTCEVLYHHTTIQRQFLLHVTVKICFHILFTLLLCYW